MTKRTNILIKRLSSVVLFLCAALAGFAQVDTAFWFAVPRLAHGHAGRPIKLCVATLDQPATVTVSKPATNTTLTTFTVPANSSQTYQLVGDAESALTGFECSPYNTPLNYGIYIHSTAKMNAYIAVQNNNSEIYALKGNSALGTQFFIPMQYQYENATYGGEARNSVQVIATENNTSVQIIPTQTLYQNGGAANSTINVTLNRGQVYNFASNTQTAAGHICGTVVTSNKPIVVDVSDDSATPNGSNQDLVADQIVPEDLAGYQHVVVPSPSSVNNSTTSGGLSDYAFIFALEDNTDVTVYYETTGGNFSQTQYTNLMRGDKRAFHFTYNKPAFVYSYHQQQDADGNITYEPRNVFVFQVTGAGNELGGTQLPHVYCTGSTKVTYRPLAHPSNHTKHLYLNLVCNANTPTGQSITDAFQITTNTGNVTIAASEWHPVPGSPAMRYCQKDISSKATSQYIQVSNSVGKFHMGMIDYHMQGSGYDDCSISYFSSYSSDFSIKWDSLVTLHNYCEGDTIHFDFDSVDANISRIFYPDGSALLQPPFVENNVGPDDSGWYTVMANDARGCIVEPKYDSIYITVHPTVYETVYDTICPDEAYTGYGFNIPATATAEVGTILDTLLLQTVGMGCDSFLILDLTVRDIVNRETVFDTVCPGHSYTGFGGLFHFPADSTAIPHLLTDSVHLTPVGFGCDSVLTLQLTVRDSVFGEFSHIACNQYTWNGHTYVESGDYTQTLTDAHGCDSIVTMHLEILEPAVEIETSGDDFCEYGEIVLNAVTDYNEYIWNTGDTTSFLQVTQPGLYTVTVTQGDCQASDNYYIDACDFTIILPNAITPSKSDGLNDCLTLPGYVHRFLSEFSIEIYNRWGSLVYYNNDMNFQWCGESGNRPEDIENNRHVINGQVYVWIVRVRNLDGKPFVYKGTITVL